MCYDRDPDGSFLDADDISDIKYDIRRKEREEDDLIRKIESEGEDEQDR